MRDPAVLVVVYLRRQANILGEVERAKRARKEAVVISGVVRPGLLAALADVYR